MVGTLDTVSHKKCLETYAVQERAMKVAKELPLFQTV